MKNYILFLSVFLFVFSACSKNDADKDDNKNCEAYYEGPDCETRQTAKFEGEYTGTFDGFNYNKKEITIVQDLAKINGLRITFINAAINAELTSSKAFQIPEQDFDYDFNSTIEGTGALENNSISISGQIYVPEQGTNSPEQTIDFQYDGVK
ncbi:MAG: hypothetical protein WD048_15055 [Chitinophagales bacterium]